MSEATISVDWGRVRFFLGEVRTNFTRNAMMQLTAIGTVAVTIVLLGTFLFVRDAVTTFGQGILTKIEIAVYLKDDVDDKRAQEIGNKLAADQRIVGARYVPKRDGLNQMRERLGKDFDTSLLTANPLPNAFRVRVRNPDDVPAVAATIAKIPGIAKADFAADTVTKLLRAAEVLGKLGLGMILLLVLTAAIIIANTIRLTVFARRREIAIMQLVGATSTYIRMPFIAEGVLAGVLGAFVAIIVLAVARIQLVPKIAATLSFVPLHANESQIALQLLGVGAVVGLIASWFSVGRYLRV
jgi:cell division transport system permease protein